MFILARITTPQLRHESSTTGAASRRGPARRWPRGTAFALLLLAAVACGAGVESASAQGTGWTFETVTGVPTAPGCGPMDVIATGLGFDLLGRPVAGWQQSDGCSTAGRPRWARKDNGTWVTAIVNKPDSGAPYPYGTWADLELAPDGTPHYIHAGNSAAYIYGSSEWAAGMDVNLDLNPVGPGVEGRLIEHRQNTCSAYPAFASDFAPGVLVPTMLIGTRCGGYAGWLWLDGVGTLHGTPIFATPQGGSGEFRNLDYASGPAGQHHVVYFVARGGGIRLAAYSNGTPNDELPLAVPHLNRDAEVSVAVGADNRVHVAIGGIPTCSNLFEGGLLYATSTDGVNWEKTFVDVTSGRDPSIVLDGAGNPVISYHRLPNEVRLARKADGDWTSERVKPHVSSATSRRSRLAFDLAGLPNVLFRNADSNELQIATGPMTGSGPELTNPGDQTNAPGQFVSLAIEASDLDGLTLNYAATCLPPGLTINPTTGVISGTVAGTAEAGSPYSVTVTTTNPDGDEAIVTFVWVIDSNVAPTAVVVAGTPAPCSGGISSVSLDGSGSSDPDGSIASRSWTTDCPGGVFSASAGVATTLTVDVVECTLTCNARLVVTDDDGAQSVQSVQSLTFSDAVAPVLSTLPSPSTIACPATPSFATPTATDACAGSVTPTFEDVTTQGDCSQEYTVTRTWTATDGCGNSSVASESISVADTTPATLSTPASSQTVACDGAGNTAELNAWLASRGGASAADACGAVTWSNDFAGFSDDCAAAGSVTVAFTATDACGNASASSATFTLNQQPVADAGPDQAVDENETVTLDGSASLDADDDPLTYTWTQVAGPDVALNMTDAIHPTFVAPLVPTGGRTLTFELVVDDGYRASEAAIVNVTVKDVNHAPVADAGDDQTLQEISLVTLDSTQSFDSDGDTLTHAWLQTAGTAVTLAGAATAAPTFTAPLVGPAGATLTFQVTVSDGLANAIDTVSVLVSNVNQAPVARAGMDQTVDEETLVTLDGSGSDDPDGDTLSRTWQQVSGPLVTLSDPLAVSPTFTAPAVGAGGVDLAFSLVVSDGLVASEADEVAVHVHNVNDPPVCSLATASVGSLWPPNHALVLVTIQGVADANDSEVVLTILGVTQDEPLNGLGDGDTGPDAVIQGSAVLLRAERSGTGNGRVYRIEFQADDGNGGSCTASTVSVTVPHSRNSTAIDSGQSYDSLGE